MTIPENVLVILVVDDEPILRMNATAMLVDAGFATIEACCSADALVQLERHPEISILFTDISMPGNFDGLELARRVHGLHPSIKLVITSGRRPADSGELTGAFVPKPYDAASIVSAMRAVPE